MDRDGLADPITGVEAMARLRNRIRRFVVDGEPAATGLIVIGDAAIATNPWYGKGCSMAGIATEALSPVARRPRTRPDGAGPRDGRRDANGDGAALRVSCRQDADRTKLHTAMQRGHRARPRRGGGRDFVLNGLIPATRVDPDVFRAFFRSFNMLDDPIALFTDPIVLDGGR